MSIKYEDGHRIYLRALEPEDHKKIHKWRRDPEYQRGVISTKRYTSKETERKWIKNAIERHESGDDIRLGVVIKETDELIGLVYLSSINHVHKRASFGSWIGEPNNRGEGYVTEARHQLMRYAFDELELRRIEACILKSNDASRRSVEKFGYTKEGVKRKHTYKNGKYNDVIVYSILKSEYRKMYDNER